jgi:hypothetical protein
MAEPSGYPKNTITSYRVEPLKAQQYMVPDPSQYQPMPQGMMPVAPTPIPGHVSYPAPKNIPSEYVNLDTTIEVGSPSPGYDAVSGKRMLYHNGPTGGKRSHEDSFGLDDRSMQNGMRPDVDPYPSVYRDFSAESRAALMAELGIDMAYKRANGRMVSKIPPNAH